MGAEGMAQVKLILGVVHTFLALHDFEEILGSHCLIDRPVQGGHHQR